MPMTAPVSLAMKYNMTDHVTKSILSFYVPTKGCNSTAPAPTDSKVKIVKAPKYCVYVRSFPGYTMGRSTFMGYNSPKQLFKRHNEVWRWPSRKEQEKYFAKVKSKRFHQTCK